ncbi:MAG: tetratricopeptide repeat protein [Myxococcota bacterium]|nr:tetratricopeptide repeat protein [Myxococcota bacterium]MDW8362720.1 tetratricopeptide repeat protein [Myxococcales bacterium]
MRNATWSSRLALGFALLVAVPPVRAQAPEQDQARRLFLSGRAAFDRGDYAEAAEYFRAAHELSGHPALLFNIGLACARADLREQAIEAFERYLREMPDAANRAEVEGHLRALRARGRDATARSDTDESRDGPGGRASASRSRGPFPWIVAIGGGALAIGGGVTFALGRADVAHVEQATVGTPWSELEGAYERAPLLTGVGLSLMGAGLAAAAVGVVLLVGAPAEDEPTSRARITLGPAGTSLDLRF